MSRTGHKAREIPWLLIAIIGGISAVIIMAVLFFSGYIPAPEAEPGSSVPVPVKTVVSTLRPVTTIATVTPAGTTPVTTTVVPDTPVITVPPSGVYLKVDYLGAYSGTYTVNGVKQAVRSSGSHLFPLPDATGTVSAVFQKEDGTTKRSLTLEIYKDGKLLQSGSVSSAYGQVNVDATV